MKNFTNANYQNLLEGRKLEILRDALRKTVEEKDLTRDQLINYLNEVAYYNFDHFFNQFDDDHLYRSFKDFEETFTEGYMIRLVDSTYNYAIGMGLWCNTKEWKAFQAQKLDNPYDVLNFGKYDTNPDRTSYQTNLSEFSAYSLSLRGFAVFSVLMHIIYDNLSRIRTNQIFDLFDHLIMMFKIQLKREVNKEAK